MLKLDVESFTNNHEMLYKSHSIHQECRCILCDIYRKHLKEVPDDIDRLEPEINRVGESE